MRSSTGRSNSQPHPGSDAEHVAAQEVLLVGPVLRHEHRHDAAAARRPPRRMPSAAAGRGRARFLFTSGVFQLRWRFAAADMSAMRSMSSSLKPRRNESGMNSMLVPGCQPHTSLSPTNSSRVAKFGGVGRPSPSTCVTTFAVEKPRPPAAIASESSARIASELLGAGGVGRRRRAHHRAPNRRVTDHEPDVGPERQRFDDVEELGEGVPPERDAGGERLDRDRFDAREQPGEEVFVAGLDRARA